MKKVPEAHKPSADDIKQEQQYQAKNDLRTLHSAHQVKSDPARHGRANRAHLPQHSRQTTRASGAYSLYDDLFHVLDASLGRTLLSARGVLFVN